MFGAGKSQSNTDEAKSQKGPCEEDSDDEFYDVERSDPSQDVPSVDSLNVSANGIAGDALKAKSTCEGLAQMMQAGLRS